MPLSLIKAQSKEELISKIIEELMASGEHTKEEAVAIAYAEAKRRGFGDQANIHESLKDAFGKIQRMNNVIKVPVTLAAEMVQKYHIDMELPWLRKKVKDEIQYIKVFKPWEEIKKMYADLQERGIDQIPFVVPHSEGTFLKDQIPKKAQSWITKSITDTEVKGYVKEFYLDEVNHKLKGWAYLTISKLEDKFINQLERGEVIDVSIGFICDFDFGGIFNGEGYTLTQRNMQLGHLAGLPEQRGKCPSGICGLNQDASKVADHVEATDIHFEDFTHIVEMHAIMTDVNLDAGYNPMSIWVSEIPILPSTNTTSSSDFMPPTIEELQKLLDAANKSIADMQSSDIKKQLTDAQKSAIDWQTKYDAIKIVKDQMEEENKKCGEAAKAKDAEIERLKTVQKDQLIAKLEPIFKDNVVTKGKKLKELCIHDLEVVADSIGIVIETGIKDNGLPKGNSEADHIAKLTGKEPKATGKASATISAADMKKMREEK